MQITTDNAKEYASNVIDRKQLADYIAWSGTKYQSKEELLENESSERVAEFYTGSDLKNSNATEAA